MGPGTGSVSGFKVARPVVAVPPPIQSSSGSEGALIPSDYPSESQSENEEVETGSLPVSSRGSSSAYENGAYVHDGISLASADHHAYGQTHELHLAGAALPPSPKFDIQVRVKRSPPPPSSLPSSMSGSSVSDTESNSSTLISHGGDRNNLSTILETQEDRDSVMTTESMAADGAQSHFTYVPELHTVPAHLDYPPSPPPIPRYNTTVNIHVNKHPNPPIHPVSLPPPVNPTPSPEQCCKMS